MAVRSNRLRHSLVPTEQSLVERNARYLLIEVFWAAFLTAAASFNALFALRLGATNTEIGLLSSIPALLALIVTIPAGQYINRLPQPMPVLLGSLLVHRLGFLLVALLPWLPLARPGSTLIWLLVAFSMPAQFFGVGWGALLADTIPEQNRARVLASRNIIVSVATTAGVFVAGRWLELGPFPLSYQVMYLTGFTASLVSIIYIGKLRVPESVRTLYAQPASAQPVAPHKRPFGPRLCLDLRQAAREHPDFVRITVNTLAHASGLWLIGPLYVLYYVRKLGATDGWIGLNSTVGSLMPILGFYLARRAIARWGENRVLRLTISVVGLHPVLVGLSPSLAVILFWTALNGLVAPSVGISHYTMLLKICPASQRALYLGVYTAVANTFAFILPLVGVRLADYLGAGWTLVLGGILCLAGSSMFRMQPLQTLDSVAARAVS